MTFEFESDVADTADWGGKWLVACQCWENFVSFDGLHNLGAVDVKIAGFILEEKPSFKMLRLSFSAKLDRGS